MQILSSHFGIVTWNISFMDEIAKMGKRGKPRTWQVIGIWSQLNTVPARTSLKEGEDDEFEESKVYISK